jgi:hypothetical protein
LLVIVASVSSTRLVALLAGAWTALAACVSFGAIAFAGAPSGALAAAPGARIGALPSDVWHLALAVLAGVAVTGIGWRGRAVAMAVCPLVLVFLPWLPFDVPAAFLLWTGALASLVWIGVGLALIRVAIAQRHVTLSPPPRPVLLPAVLSCVVFATAAWFAAPAIPGGDEPHYLVITQSLLYDRDLRIANNHQRGDYRAYFAGELPPHSIRPGRNGEVYSIHAPGVPALVLPAFAIGGYLGVVVFLVLLSSAGCALAWWLSWRATGSMAAAWFGWAAVTASAPFLLESYTVFPDGPGAVVVLTGFWALMRAGWETEGIEGREGVEGEGIRRINHRSWVPWLLHGLGLAVLPWMHTRFSVLAATLGGLILVRLAHTPNPLAKASAFLALPAISALAWLFFFTVLYGAPDPSAPYGSQPQNVLAFFPNGAGGLLFDQGFGLFATAPVLAIAIAGFIRTRRLAIEWLVVAVPYLLAVATFAMWWAGMSGPARFLVPLLLPLAIPAAYGWAAFTSRGARAVMLTALVVTVWLSAVMAGAGDGRLGYHTRNEGGATAAPWMEWANRVIDLPAGFPAFVPRPVGTALDARVTAAKTGFAATLPWALCLGGASLFLVWFLRKPVPSERPRGSGLRVEGPVASPVAAVALTTLTFGCATMVALSITWRIGGATAETPISAQLEFLGRLASDRMVALDVSTRRRLSIAEAWGMRIAAPIRRGAGAGPRNRALAAFPIVPAGSYVISARRHAAPGSGEGWVMVGVGNDQFAIATQPIAAYDAGVPIELPVKVRGLFIRADEGARDQLDAIELRPVAPPAGRHIDAVARRAVRYESHVVFFIDDRAFPEPSGFWVGGARATVVAIRPDRPRAVALALRNGAAANVVTLQSGGWREEIAMQAGEERRVDVPIDAPRGAALVTIRSSAGFRPSQVDPASRDTRFLGVYVRTLEP